MKNKIDENKVTTAAWIIFLAVSIGLFIFIHSCKKEDPVPENYVASIQDSKFLPIVRVTINNKPAYMIMDTGASVSVLDENQLGDYGIHTTGQKEEEVTGYGGSDTAMSEISSSEVMVGTVRMSSEFNAKNLSEIVRTVSDQTGYRIVGILGNNNISRAGLKLDFQRGQILR